MSFHSNIPRRLASVNDEIRFCEWALKLDWQPGDKRPEHHKRELAYWQGVKVELLKEQELEWAEYEEAMKALEPSIPDRREPPVLTDMPYDAMIVNGKLVDR